MESSTQSLVSALQILAREIETEDGVVNSCLSEAALRLETLSKELEDARQLNKDTFETLYGNR
jgi:hypothetical protein